MIWGFCKKQILCLDVVYLIPYNFHTYHVFIYEYVSDNIQRASCCHRISLDLMNQNQRYCVFLCLMCFSAFPLQASRMSLSPWTGWKSGWRTPLPQKKSTTPSSCVLTANCTPTRWEIPRGFPCKLLSSSMSATVEGRDWTVSQSEGVVSSQIMSFCKTEMTCTHEINFA